MNVKILLFIILVAVSAGLVAAAAVISPAQLPYPIKITIFVIGLLMDIFAIFLKDYSEFMIGILGQRSKNVVVSSEAPYVFSSARDALVVKSGDGYNATIYVKIPIYRSSTEMKIEERVDFARMVGRMVGQSRNVARYTTGMFVMNKDMYIQQLRESINAAENEESSAVTSGQSSEELARIRGKLSMWRNILDSVNSNVSYEQISYASVTAFGTNEFEAVSIAQQHGRELISGIGTLFGVQPAVITGSELLRFIEPEYQLPYSTMAENISKSVEEEVI
jgi:hypothetical protein